MVANKIRTFFHLFGIDFIKYPPKKSYNKEAPKPHGETPSDALNQSLWNKQCIINMDIDKMINVAGFSYGLNGFHPFTHSLLEIINGRNEGYSGSVLEKFYQKFTPQNQSELFFKGKIKTNSNLDDLPPVPYASPFSVFGSFEKAFRKQKEWAMSDNKSMGIDLEIYPWNEQTIGPSSFTKGNGEYSRLVKVFKLIEKNGYLRDGTPDGDPHGILLRRENEFRLMIINGNHRPAILAALGYEKMPIRLRTNYPIDIRDIKSWALVKNGDWPIDWAEKAFNNFFDFDTKKWAIENKIINE